MMTTSSTPHISDHIRQLSEKITTELEQLNGDPWASNQPSVSLVYIGHWQDAIPRAIWVDPLLDAIDVRAWGILRTQAVLGSAVLLSLNRLLQEQLGYSKPTISKVLYVLRLTRWISWCSEMRNAAGQFKGHIYAVHDKPLPFNDAIYLDHHYLAFVRQQQAHKNKQIKTIAQSLWQTLTALIEHHQDFLSDASPSGAINDLMDQMNGTDRVKLFNPADQVKTINLGQTHRVNKFNPVKGKTGTKENQSLNNQVKNIDPAGILTTTTTSCSSVCSSSSFSKNLNKKTTTTNASASEKQSARAKALIFPAEFNDSEIELAHLYLNRIDPDLQQDFLDETAAQIAAKRKTSKPIRNPLAYLSWLCNEHARSNTLLTSLGIRYRENRERKQQTEQHVRAKQQQLAQMAKAKSEANPEPEPPDLKSDRSMTKTTPWGKLHVQSKGK